MLKLFLFAEDTKAPTILKCPSGILTTVEEGSGTSPVFWIEPEVEDESGNTTLIVQTHVPGDTFVIGSTSVVYLFEDMSHNNAVCSFVVRLDSGKCLIEFFKSFS